jgi:hypothetical protein
MKLAFFVCPEMLGSTSVVCNCLLPGDPEFDGTSDCCSSSRTRSFSDLSLSALWGDELAFFD